MRRPSWSPTVLGVLGAGLLVVPARRLRPDLLLCAEWPPLPVGAVYGAVYLAGVSLLCLSWGAARRQLGGRPLRQVLLLGLPVHLTAVLGPPFLSQDPLFYAALGRSLAAGGRPDQPVDQVLRLLPGAGAFLHVLPPHWRGGISTYGPGFDALAAAIGALAGDRLWLHLRLYQAVSAAAALGCAALTGLAAGPGAAALVLFCPLLVIEGSQGAHNDALLALSMAAFALALARAAAVRGPAQAAAGPAPSSPGATLPALLALAAGLLVKASGVLVLALWGAAALLRRIPAGRLRPLGAAVIALCGAAVLAVALGRRFTPVLAAAGSPDGAFEYCTRSIECLPRVLLRYRLGMPGAAWLVGLAFRGLGLLWLLRCATAAAADRDLRRAAATFLFGYYLYLHGWSQSWYLLPLLPLLPYADPRLRPAMLTLCVTAVCYYALAIPLGCLSSDLAVALVDLAEAVVVIIPPSLVLYWRLRHGRDRS